MDAKKTLIIGLSGNFLSDQRMQRIATAVAETSWEPIVYYRDYYKYKNGKALKVQSFSYQTYALRPMFKSGILFYLWFNLILFFRLLFKKTEAYYAVDSDTLLAFTLLSKLHAKPLVYDAHEYFAEVPELNGKSLKKKLWHWLTKWGVKQAKLCITVGAELAIELERVYGKPFACVRNVPVLNTEEPASTQDKKTIIYQGALNEGRELELLIDAMKELSEYHCILVGEGDLSAALRQRAEGFSNIEFLGLLSPEELKNITSKCFAGYNLLDASGSLSYYYSLSNKYFDYMHASLPSISSELPEYIKLNAAWKCGVCIPNSKYDLIGLLNFWKNSPSEYVKLKENTKFAAQGNNWNLEKEALKNLLTF
jgi:glycosyltransferase involved in cell wall biosynthesis